MIFPLDVAPVGSTDIYVTFVIAFFTIDVIPWIVLFALLRAGGPRESYYRFRGIKYKQFYFLNEIDQIERRLVKLKDFHHSSAAHVSVPGRGDYLVTSDTRENFHNPHGAPASIYNWDDARPIQVKGQEPDLDKPVTEIGADGKPTQSIRHLKGAKCPPMMVHRAYADDRLEKLHDLGRPSQKWKWGIYGLAIFLTLLAAGLGAYYSYYFGINTACAVHAQNVACH